MNNIMKKSIIFVLLGLMAQPAYPGFGMDTVSRWGRGALSSMYESAKNHPWMTGAAVGAAVLGAGALYWYKKSNESKKPNYAEIPFLPEEYKVAEPTQSLPKAEDSIIGCFIKNPTAKMQDKKVFASSYYTPLSFAGELTSMMTNAIGISNNIYLNGTLLHHIFNIDSKSSCYIQDILALHTRRFNQIFIEKNDELHDIALTAGNINTYAETLLVDSLAATDIKTSMHPTLVFIRKDESNKRIMHYAYEKDSSTIVICTPAESGKSWKLSALQCNGYRDKAIERYCTGTCELPKKSLVITMSNNVSITPEKVRDRAIDFIKEHANKKQGDITKKSMNELSQWIMKIAQTNAEEEAFISVMYV